MLRRKARSVTDYMMFSTTIPANPDAVRRMTNLAAELNQIHERAGQRYSVKATLGFWNNATDPGKHFMIVLAKAVAASDDGRVEWNKLCQAYGLPPRRMTGVLGAFYRRRGVEPPFNRDKVGETYWFTMPPEVVKLLLQLDDKA